MIVASAGIQAEGVQNPLVQSTRITEVSSTITDVNNFHEVLTIGSRGHGGLLLWLQNAFLALGMILIALSIFTLFEGRIRELAGRFTGRR